MIPRSGPRPGRFNEAACNTGGTRRNDDEGDTRRDRFNEAACNTGGTPVPRGRDRLGDNASMRPPAIQAERPIALNSALAPSSLQ